jgi:cytochrome oxidase Cu insertion factor (SCO1/SenC/PrrC family)
VGAGSYVPFFADGAQKPVPMKSFELDRYPVTRKQFLDFVRSHPEWRRSQAKQAFTEPAYLSNWRSDLDPGTSIPLDAPISQVSWFAARAYCGTTGGALPTTDQWEYAADDQGRGRQEARERSLEWFSQPGSAPLPSVRSSRLNSLGLAGLYDLVWEWTEDFGSSMMAPGSRFDCGSASLGAVDPADYAAFMRYSFRQSLKATYTTGNLGFRCVKAAKPQDEPASAAGAFASESLYQLDSSWRDQDGRDVRLSSYAGTPVVMAMIYTRCQTTCPLIVSAMQRIQKRLPESIRAHTRFALFSFDSDGENPESLKAFARAHGLDPAHWSVLSGQSGDVKNLAALLNVKYKKIGGGNFSHTSGISYLDAQGVMVRQIDDLLPAAE